MLFTSVEFVSIFLPVIILGYYAIPGRWRAFRNLFLLAGSLVFYGYGEPRFVLVLAASCLVNWAAAFFVAPGASRFRRLVLALDIVANLSLLGWFKYAMFAGEQVNAAFGLSLHIPKIALPLGISFFTFQALSYVLDVFRGTVPLQRNPLDVTLYVSLFPQLVAGPIVRYETIQDQIRNRHETWGDFSAGLCRFAIGFAKKMLLANPMAMIADTAFEGANWIPFNTANPGIPFSVSLAWVGAVAYAFQIFFDFSGYSDMAIGMGRMFGFHFLENFRHPYVSRSVSDFWRRWHISMGTWFRDYVYFPLGGSRVRTRARLFANLFAVWFLTGLWHGANWTFIAWGLMYFVLVSVEKLAGRDERNDGLVKSVFGWLYTAFFVLLGWVFFRAPDLVSGGRFVGAMFGIGTMRTFDPQTALLLRENAVFFFFAFLVSTTIPKRIADAIRARIGRGTLVHVVAELSYTAWIVAIFAISLSYLAKGAHNPFIYFNF